MKLNINFVVETHLNNLDAELTIILKKAGMSMVKVGIESVDEDVLKSSKRKSISIDSQMEKIRTIEKLNIQVVTMYIIGMIGDTKQTVKNTIKYAKKLNTYISQFSIFTPYPGTPVYKEYRDKINLHKYEDFNQYNLVFNHPSFDNKSARSLLDKAYENYYLRPRWIIKFIISNIRNI